VIDYSNVRYLLAKQPIDDRAINRQVLAALERELVHRSAELRVLELGAGVGTMVSRLADWGVLGRAQYTLIDRDLESLASARQHLEGWGTLSQSRADAIRIEKGGALLDVEFVRTDLFDFLTAARDTPPYDLVIANAVLDLTELGTTLPRIWQAQRPGSLFWFTINFDGETIFLPELALDERVMGLYHESMGPNAAGTRSGHSQTGRRLIEAIPASGGTLLAAGGSDWVVFPHAQVYPGDEAYFLHHIVDTIRGALIENPGIEPGAFEDWVATRHAQIERGELVYIAHQLDVFGRAPKI
jgi:SAM-dependent methyltransferase